MYYSTFGLSIRSDIPMPEFLPGSGPHDVEFRFGAVPAPDCPIDGPIRAILPTGDGTLLHWNRIGTFLVENGTTVTVSPLAGVDERLVRLVLSGPALGVLLSQRGLCVFHASVVALPDADGAIAVVARKGGGKSTVAAALYNAGYYMMSDDIMAMTVEWETAVVEPGFPHAKLWAESVEALVADADTLVRIGPDFDKRSRPITERFRRSRAPLRAVFVLADGPHVSLRRLSGHESLRQLLPHWYGALFDGQLMPVLGRERHFEETALLARSVPVFELTRPFSFGRLPEVVREVSEALGRTASQECRLG